MARNIVQDSTAFNVTFNFDEGQFSLIKSGELVGAQNIVGVATHDNDNGKITLATGVILRVEKVDISEEWVAGSGAKVSFGPGQPKAQKNPSSGSGATLFVVSDNGSSLDVIVPNAGAMAIQYSNS